MTYLHESCSSFICIIVQYNVPTLACLKEMLWEAELRPFSLSPPQHGFPPHNFHDFSCIFLFEDKSIVEDNGIQIASDLGLISLCSSL